MMRNLSLRLVTGLSALTLVSLVTSSAIAQDFFSSFFRGNNQRSASEQGGQLSYAPDSGYRGDRGYGAAPSFDPFGFEQQQRQVPRRATRHVTEGGGSSQAYCVRTCDGRAFPISTTGEMSKAETCKSFCPASDTKVAYGSSLENASLENGKPYSSLPNAFKFRNELVAGCTCNGKDQLGLAPVKIEDDPTLRKGDIVAGADGLMVSKGGFDKRGASLKFSPVAAAVQAKYARVPVVASE